MHSVIPTIEFDDNIKMNLAITSLSSEHLVRLWVLYFLVIIYCHLKHKQNAILVDLCLSKENYLGGSLDYMFLVLSIN